MKIIIYATITIITIAVAAFLGKTTINFTDGIYSIERPLTAIFFLLTVLFGLLNK